MKKAEKSGPARVISKIVTEFDDNRIALSMRECAIAIGVSERSIWSMVKSGRLASFKIGRSVRISRDAIEAFIENEGAS